MKIYNDTISYSDNCKVTIGGKEIKGMDSWGLGDSVDIANRESSEYQDFFNTLKSGGECAFSLTFKSTSTESNESLQKVLGDYIKSNQDLSEYIDIKRDIGLYIEDELYCYIDVGIKKKDPTIYFIGLSEIKEGKLYED